MEEEIHVVGWDYFEDLEGSAKHSIGGLGGWFGYSEGNNEKRIRHRWKDYIEYYDEEERVYREAMRVAILDMYESAEEASVHTGNYHQNADDGCPMFSDGTVALFSMRAWGDFMAAVWSEKDDKDYCYIDFYY